MEPRASGGGRMEKEKEKEKEEEEKSPICVRAKVIGPFELLPKKGKKKQQ